MSTERISGPQTVKLRVEGPLFVPFLDANYYPTEPFDCDIHEVRASTTSGSPFVMADNLFAGVLKFASARIAWDGAETLTVDLPEGQEMLVGDGSDLYGALDEYNRIIIDERYDDASLAWGDPDLLTLHEYCTWMEQRYCKTAGSEFHILDHTFVENYANSVDAMDYPPGKFTIDAGWFVASGPGGTGDWDPDLGKFPDIEATARMLSDRGHRPGVWIAPFLADPDSRLASDPACVTGETFTWMSPDVPGGRKEYAVVAANDTVRAHFVSVVRRLRDAGFRKIKSDIFYGPKKDLEGVMRIFAEAVREVDADMELECHVPDIFLSKYCNVVRTNDIWIHDNRSFGMGPYHFRVCRLSSPHRVTNLDHIGGNGFLSEADHVNTHLGTMFNQPGYPCLGMLPNRFGARTVDLVRLLFEQHLQRRGQMLSLVLGRRPGTF